MIIDYVSGIGSFPFRHVQNSTPKALIKLMDENNISKSLVTANEAIMYRNVQAANELLMERISAFTDRLIPAAVINPVYACANEDLDICINKFDMMAVKLMPAFHGYDMSNPAVSEVLERVEELQVPVSIVFRVEDDRQHHWLINPPPVNSEIAAGIIRNFPNINFILERATLQEFNNIYNLSGNSKNWFVEISSRSLPVKPLPENLHHVIDKIGCEKMLFATDIPLQYAQCTIMKLESLELQEGQKALVLYKNAAKLLKLSP